MDKIYKIGDKVWIMYNNQPKEVEVTSIANKQERKGDKVISTYIVYGLEWTRYNPSYGLYLHHYVHDQPATYISEHFLDDNMVFSTKEELVNSLL